MKGIKILTGLALTLALGLGGSTYFAVTGYQKNQANRDEIKHLQTIQKDKDEQFNLIVEEYKKNLIESQEKYDLLQQQKESLEKDNESNLATIGTLNNDIENLNSQISRLLLEKSDLENRLAESTDKSQNFENEKANLLSQIAEKDERIQELSTDLASKNTQITNLNNQIEANTQTINTLNATIEELNTTIRNYQNYISDLEIGEKVIATFIDDNEELLKILVADKGSTITLEELQDQEDKKFDAWYVNGVRAYKKVTLNYNTTFEAKYTKIHTVKFVSEDKEVSLKVLDGRCIDDVPDFERLNYVLTWKLNGEIIPNISNYQITSDLTFIAHYEEVKPDVVVLDFVFNNGELISYTGKETEITIPSSYSLGGFVDQEIIFEDMYSLASCIMMFEHIDVHNLFLGDGTEIIIPEGTSWIDYLESQVDIDDESIYPMQLQYVAQQFIEGDDIKVTQICDQSFAYCDFTKVIISEGITDIGSYAFSDCHDLLEIVLPNSLKVISYNAFVSCTSLTKIEIPEGIEELCDEAFNSCGNLSAVVFKGSKPPTIHNYTFSSCDCFIYVNDEDMETYQESSTVWANLIANGKVKPISELIEG